MDERALAATPLAVLLVRRLPLPLRLVLAVLGVTAIVSLLSREAITEQQAPARPVPTPVPPTPLPAARRTGNDSLDPARPDEPSPAGRVVNSRWVVGAAIVAALVTVAAVAVATIVLQGESPQPTLPQVDEESIDGG